MTGLLSPAEGVDPRSGKVGHHFPLQTLTLRVCGWLGKRHLRPSPEKHWIFGQRSPNSEVKQPRPGQAAIWWCDVHPKGTRDWVSGAGFRW